MTAWNEERAAPALQMLHPQFCKLSQELGLDFSGS